MNINFLLYSFVIFIFIFFMIYRIAIFFNFFDKKELYINNKKIPMIGGLLIFFTAFFSFFFTHYELSYLIILSIGFLFIVLGIIDDLFDVHPYLRLFIQIIIIYFSLISFNVSFFSSDNISFFYNSKFIQFFFVLFLLLTSINAFNFMDGSDGLISSISISSIISSLFILFRSNVFINFEFYILFLSVILFFMILNFGIFNLKIYLGNSGSIFLGFIIPFFFINEISGNYNNLFLPVLFCIFLPVFNIVSVILIRVLNNKNPFKPDFLHIHHIFSFYGIGRFKIILILNLLILLLNYIFFIFHYFFGNFYSLFFGIILFFIFFSIHLFISKKNDFISYHNIN